MKTRMFTTLSLCIALLFILPFRTYASSNTTESLLVFDVHTGTIVESQNIDAPFAISELAKTMTLYLVLEAIEQGELSWESTYTVPKYLEEIASKDLFFDVPLKEGEVYEIKQLYNALLIQQSVASSIALAELVSGDELQFVEEMNAKAKELKMENTLFINASGVKGSHFTNIEGYSNPAGESDEPIATARSLGKLAYQLYHDFPFVSEDASQLELIWGDTELPSKNALLQDPTYAYPFANGLFLGESELAGYTLLATAQKGKQKLVAIILNSKDEEGQKSEVSRYQIAKAQFDNVFASYTDLEIVAEGKSIEAYKYYPVKKGKQKKVEIVTETALRTLVPANFDEEVELKVVYEMEEDLSAPVKPSTRIGELRMMKTPDDSFEFIIDRPHAVALVTREEVPKKSGLSLVVESFTSFFKVWSSLIMGK